MFRKLILAIATFFLCLTGQTAQAQNSINEQVFKLCPALSQKQTYEKDEDFRYMVAGKDGWIYRTDMDLKTDFELSEWSKLSFERLYKAFKHNGTEVAVMMIPTRGIVGYTHLLPPYKDKYDQPKAKKGYGKLLSDIENAGYIVANMRDVDTIPGFFLKRDNHWTAIGAKYAAQRVADAVKKSPVYQTLRKEEFKTDEMAPEAGDDKANDRFLEFIEEKCKQKIPAETLPALYATAPADTKKAADKLLGEAEKPEVALLGTSNSTNPEPSFANFAGFLKEDLSVDIKNEAIAGGSFRGSLANYVLLGDYARANPKLIIWELSAHYGFGQEATFREVIPALYGECSEEDTIVKTHGTLTSEKTTIFDNLSQYKMMSFDYYIYLKLENEDIRNIKITFQHEENRSDTMKFRRSRRNFPENNGVYFAELKYGLNDSLKSVVLNVNGKASGDYTAKLCRAPKFVLKERDPEQEN